MRRHLILIALLFIAGGCYGRVDLTDDDSITPPPPPRLSLPELVGRINANNAKLPSLWATGYFEALIVEEAGADGRLLNGTVTLLHLKPGRLRLKVEKDLGGDVLDLGTDGEQLWLGVPYSDEAYVGTVGNLDPRKTEGLPISPDLILQVIGVNLVPTTFLDWPAPVLEYNPDADVHMLKYVEPAALGEPRLKVSRQVWYKVPPAGEGPPLPVKVIVSGEEGEPLMVANLSYHDAVEGAEGDPLAAQRFTLFFPPTGSKMLLRLEDVKLSIESGRGRRKRTFPNAGSFDFSPRDVGAAQVFNLDRE